MKIRKVLDKKVGEKEYKKFLVTLPKNVVLDSKLLEKDIEAVLEEGNIILRKKAVKNLKIKMDSKKIKDIPYLSIKDLKKQK